MIWELEATGSRRQQQSIDHGELRRALLLLADPEQGIQLQAAPYWGHATFRGNDPDNAMVWVCAQEHAANLYYGLNPVKPELEKKTRNQDALSRRWFLIDVDRAKTGQDKDDPATDAEHEAARELTESVREWLASQGWPLPVVVDSGNGYHLLYRLDLPNDALSRSLVRAGLHALAKRFNGEKGSIGAECHDARRIAKLPGTMAMRGAASPERPYRPCRIVFAPQTPEVVPVELLQALGGVEEKTDQGGIFELQASTSQAYGRRALEAEMARVIMAPKGDPEKGRNNSLNRAAFNLGQLVAGGVLKQSDVEDGLRSAAIHSGLDRDPGCGMTGIENTIRSGLEAGMKEPRKAPERNGKHEKTEEKKADNAKKLKRLTIKASTITPKKVDWLWPDRIPKGFLTLFAGRTDLGKSFVVCDMIARITRGKEIPFRDHGEAFQVGSALFISEDPYDTMLAPRLIAAGADMSKVHFLTWEALMEYSLSDVEFLKRAFEEAENPKLIAVDPPTNFLGETDEHKNSEVRQLLMKLVLWIQKQDAACILITHVNKQVGKGVEALARVMGSVAWTTTTRVVHSFAPDPNNPEHRLFVPTKNNLGKKPLALLYEIVATEDHAKINWLGEVDTTADEAMSGDKGRPRRIVASEWLIDRFREKSEWLSEDLFARAAVDGVSRNAIFEAKTSLRLPRARQSVAENGDKSFVWWVPDNWPPLFRSTQRAGQWDSVKEETF